MTDVAHLPGFSRRNGTLYCEALAVRSLAEHFGTPLYLYSRQGLETAAADWLNGIKGTHHRVFFAVKSCSTLAVLRLFDRLGPALTFVAAENSPGVSLQALLPKKSFIPVSAKRGRKSVRL